MREGERERENESRIGGIVEVLPARSGTVTLFLRQQGNRGVPGMQVSPVAVYRWTEQVVGWSQRNELGAAPRGVGSGEKDQTHKAHRGNEKYKSTDA